MGGFPSPAGCGRHPREGGVRGNKGPFDGGQRSETTLYLRRILLARREAPLSLEQQLDHGSEQDEGLSPRRSGPSRLPTSEQSRVAGWRGGERKQRSHFLHSAPRHTCLYFLKPTLKVPPKWALLIPARGWKTPDAIQPWCMLRCTSGQHP